jgi:hypothetical protein
VAHTCNLATQEAEIRRIRVPLQPGHHKKRADRVAQVVCPEFFFSKRKKKNQQPGKDTSNPSTWGPEVEGLGITGQEPAPPTQQNHLQK